MPLIRQKFITRQDMRDHPDWLYVFGDNLERKGFGGQAYEMRGESNAIGLPTKLGPAPDAFLHNDDLYEIIYASSPDCERIATHLDKGGTVVWPTDGIGTGRAQLAEHAPVIKEYYDEILKGFEK